MRRVVVTGMGIVSSIGNNTQEVVASLREAKSGIVRADKYVELGFRCQVHGAPSLEPEGVVDRRAMRFLGGGAAWNHVAMEQAIRDAGLEPGELSHEMTGIIMGSGGPSTRAIVEAADLTRSKGPKRVGPFAVPKCMSSTTSATLGKAAVFALVVAVVLAIPLGAWIGHLHRFSFFVVSVGNVLRSLPTLAIIAIGIALYGFGVINITVALVILAFPLVLTNTFTAVEGVDPGTVEAARGMGMTGWQILTRVELPSAIPLISSGIRTSWVYVVATAYLATFAGSQGTLGDIISNVEGYNLSGVLAAATISIILAFLGDALIGAAERALTPTGLRLAARTPAPA